MMRTRAHRGDSKKAGRPSVKTMWHHLGRRQTPDESEPKGLMTMASPKNKERPNASEKPPKKDTSAVIRGLGSAAIKGSQR